MTTERIEGPTPHGGIYAIVVYSNAGNAEVEKEEATHADVTEYDEWDDVIAQNYAPLGDNGEIDYGPGEPTPI